MYPLVSIVIPAYNAEEFLAEALESALEQDYRPLEVVVVDDGSTDGSDAVAESFVSRFRKVNAELRVLRHEENYGAAQALRTGCANASGEFVCWLSADDAFIDTGKTRLQSEFMLRTGCDVSYFKSFLLGPNRNSATRVTRHWFHAQFAFLDPWVECESERMLWALLFANAINGSSVMVRMRAYRDVCGFDSALRNVDADGDLWMRILLMGGRIRGIEGCPLFYRSHVRQTTQSDPTMRPGIQATRVRVLHALVTSPADRFLSKGLNVIALQAMLWAPASWPAVAYEVATFLSKSSGAGLRRRWLARRLRRLAQAGDLRPAEVGEIIERIEASPIWRAWLSRWRTPADLRPIPTAHEPPDGLDLPVTSANAPVTSRRVQRTNTR